MLEKKNVEIGEERPARKQPLTDKEARALLASVSKVIVAKGKASREIAAADATLDDLRGNSGNFRAPMIRKGKTLLVGFHPGTLETMIG